MRRAAIGVLMAVAACSSRGPRTSADRANAAVPAAWRDKIAFVQTVIVPHPDEDPSSTITLGVPRGWKHVVAPYDFEPSDSEGVHRSPTFGQFVSMSTFANCDPRNPKDGPASAAAADQDLFAGYHDRGVLRDEPEQLRRVMVVRDFDALSIIVAWWRADASPCYWACRATVAPESRDLLPAFEAACRHATVQ